MIFGAPPAALLGAYAFNPLRIPAGTFTGAMVGVGLLIASPEITPPRSLDQLLQVFVGVLVGLRLSRDSLVAGFAVGLTGMSPATALFAAAPGGHTEMATIGVGLGADGPSITGETDADLVRVAFTHLFRLSATIVVVPLLVTTMLA